MSKNQSYRVNLSIDERAHLENLISGGVENARKLTRARILLKADEGWIDKEISQALDVESATVGRVRKNYSEKGLIGALNRKAPEREYPRKLTGSDEAHLVALTCSEPPDGYASWTLRLLSERLVTLEQVDVDSISHETIRRTLKKMNLSLGRMYNG